ncbi:MAG: hypothetical protein GY822_27990 [Deltaproteobacteria bacterium]|nr:hypothetical protein [Deltaproteobacteria bacterium]
MKVAPMSLKAPFTAVAASLVFAFIGGCEKKSDTTTASSIAICPSDAVVESLHKAAFHLQNGPNQKGREELEKAHRLSSLKSRTHEVESVLKSLDLVAATIDSKPDEAATEVEQVRFFFSVWSCLSKSLHDHFHEALPPVPE